MKAFTLKTYQFLFIFFSFSIPLQGRFHIFPTILGIILLILLPFVLEKQDLLKLKNSVFFLYIFLLLFIIINSILTKRYEDMKIIEKMVIPLFIIIISLPILKITPAIIGFVSGSIIAIIISSINLIIYIKGNNAFHFANGEEINNVLYTERPYLGYICVMSFCLLMYLQQLIHKKLQKTIIYLLSLGILVFLFIISARLSLITVLLITLYLLIVNKISYKLKIGIFLCLIGISIGIFYKNKNLQERFLIKNNKVEKLAEVTKEEPRSYIWDCAVAFIKKEPFTLQGMGFYNTEKYMIQCFSSSNKFISEGQKEWFINSHFNTHNQFLDFYLGEGLIAFILFLSVFFALIYKLYKNKISIILVFSLVLFCLFENMLHRQEGGYLFGLTLVLAFFLYYENRKSLCT